MGGSSPLTGLVSVIIVVALLGGLAFLGLTGMDVISGDINSAKARSLDQRTTYQSAKDSIDLVAYQQSVALQTQREKALTDQQMTYEIEQSRLAIEKMKADQAREKARQDQLMQIELEFERAVRQGLVLTVILAGLLIAGSLAFLILPFFFSRFTGSGGAPNGPTPSKNRGPNGVREIADDNLDNDPPIKNANAKRYEDRARNPEGESQKEM